MTTNTFNALEKVNDSPAKAGTPNRLKALGQLEAEIQQGMRLGVPPSGGKACANTMTLKIHSACERADGSPAEAGTPNPEIQQGMKELEGMLK